MIHIRKDEAEYLKGVGLGDRIIGKTRHGKKYAVEFKDVINALRKYNQQRVSEG